MVAQKWENKQEEQPEVWFESKESIIQEAISSYFENESQSLLSTVTPTETGWSYGGLECKKSETRNSEENIQVNCNYSG
ncbi:hypothetical protein [Mycoplasma suis]|uniref:Uncharacterized protein n=1 Tax=Mycoplasma suis (strain Illinois) TaxID=768700 RepID=F0QQJ6_MYCSL|nr:hypothetical protein [Mycoplasma suis]ADX97766.1 hypothetical protein MSU_0222 [Mycoplasma suis str. Illinois]